MSGPGSHPEQFRWPADDERSTERLGRALAAELRPGDVIALFGPVGSGKTRFVRAVATALGVDEEAVTSPTFVLIHEYEGRIPLYHVDAYRLGDSAEFVALGGEEVFAGDRACLIEWADRIRDVLPEDHLRVEIAATGETSREFRMTPTGARSRELVAAVRKALSSCAPG